MSLATSFLETQRARAHRYAYFAASLRPERTVFLADLLADPSYAEDLQIAGWFDRPRFLMRIEAMCAFFAERGIAMDRQPLVFFQVPDYQKDAAQHACLLAGVDSDLYQSRFGGASPSIRYLHTDTNFTEMMDGSWEFADRSICPGLHFRNLGWMGLYPDDAAPELLGNGVVVGYHVPDYTALLGVPGWIATDYFARFVIHDIGHKLLPQIRSEREPLHDVTMLYAMGAGPEDYASAWDELVHRECTDPYFFLEAARILRRIQRSSLTPEQALFLYKLKTHFTKETSAKKRQLLWNLPPKRKGEHAKRHVRGKLHELFTTNFARYAA